MALMVPVLLLAVLLELVVWCVCVGCWWLVVALLVRRLFVLVRPLVPMVFPVLQLPGTQSTHQALHRPYWWARYYKR
jgi:hypothetical protein